MLYHVNEFALRRLMSIYSSPPPTESITSCATCIKIISEIFALTMNRPSVSVFNAYLNLSIFAIYYN